MGERKRITGSVRLEMRAGYAARLLPIALAASWIVGDRGSDLAAGRNAGLAGGLLLLSGYIADQPGELRYAQTLAGARFRIFAAP